MEIASLKIMMIVRNYLNKNNYVMYNVFNKVLQSDMGKTIVRKYAPNLDSQSVWRDFESHMSTSSKALNEKHRLHTYVYTTVYVTEKYP